MTAQDVVRLAQTLGVALFAHNGDILAWPADAVSDDLAHAIRSRKPALLELLEREEPPFSGAKEPSPEFLDLVERIAAPLNATRVTNPVLLAAADAMYLESEGLRDPPNLSVHKMFDEARTKSERFGVEASITAWLRANAPEVAKLWQDAPLNACWFDWRRRVGRDHMVVLDRAYRAVVEELRARRFREKGGDH